MNEIDSPTAQMALIAKALAENQRRLSPVQGKGSSNDQQLIEQLKALLRSQ